MNWEIGKKNDLIKKFKVILEKKKIKVSFYSYTKAVKIWKCDIPLFPRQIKLKSTNQVDLVNTNSLSRTRVNSSKYLFCNCTFPKISFIAHAFLLSSSPSFSTITRLIDSLTESLVNDPSFSFLGISNPTCLPTRSLAIKPWSEQAPGKRINTRPDPRASVTELHPQWVKKPPIDGWAMIRFCGAQPTQTKPRPETRASKPVIIRTPSSRPDSESTQYRVQRKGRSFRFSCPAIVLTSPSSRPSRRHWPPPEATPQEWPASGRAFEGDWVSQTQTQDSSW